MTILVLGGTGYVGSRLVPLLQADGHRVRCLVRDRSKARFDGVDLAEGDASDRAKIDEAVAGVDRIVYLIHSMTGRDPDFESLDRRIAENVADAAGRHKIGQIVYLGGLGRAGSDQSAHLRSRHSVAYILRKSSIPLTELRAAVIVGAGSTSFEMIRYLVSRLPVMVCPKWVKMRTQPIAIDDVLAYLRVSLTTERALGQTIDIGGPDILSYRDMMVTVSRLMKLRRLIIPVPVLTPWLSSHWVNLVTPIAAPLARALIESVRNETVCENDLARRLFDIEPIGFAESVARALRTVPVSSAEKNSPGVEVK